MAARLEDSLPGQVLLAQIQNSISASEFLTAPSQIALNSSRCHVSFEKKTYLSIGVERQVVGKSFDRPWRDGHSNIARTWYCQQTFVLTSICGC